MNVPASQSIANEIGPRVRAYLELCRLPNVFTAAADVAMGFLITHGASPPWGMLALLLVCSCLQYTAGIVLNDFFDLDVDALERPRRPLPSGRVSVVAAKRLGTGLLLGGWLAGCGASLVSRQGRSAAVATLLAAAVLSYDGWAKRTSLAPWLMGSCRMLNVLLGMSAAELLAAGAPRFAGMEWRYGAIAVGLGVYVAGITLFARSEARESRRGALVLGLGVMGAGLAVLSEGPSWFRGGFSGLRVSPVQWRMCVVLLSVSILWRAARAAWKLTPGHVQAAVRHAILSLVVLDAAVTLVYRDLPAACAILLLLVPALFLGRFIYST